MLMPVNDDAIQDDCFTNEIMEISGQHFHNCAFIDCEFVGVNAIFTRCTFYANEDTTIFNLRNIIVIDCLFDTMKAPFNPSDKI